MKKFYHPFHIVEFRPWPITRSIRALLLTLGLVKWFHYKSLTLLTLALLTILFSIYQWWRDICREASLQGFHTFVVSQGIRWGIILFIASEVLFFFSFFWAFFHSRLSPCIETGLLWPPHAITTLEPFSVPLLNTIILLASGVTVTWTHHSLLEARPSQAKKRLWITILLGFYFTIVQAWEYLNTPFSIADSAYGATFFIATGFHGLHVIIGASFLTICLLRLELSQFSSNHHFGFEAAAWYWHFVDVVWLFLFTFIYWWGRSLFSIIKVQVTSNY